MVGLGYENDEEGLAALMKAQTLPSDGDEIKRMYRQNRAIAFEFTLLRG